MQKQFTRLNKNSKEKEIYCHVTNATDTGNIKFVFNPVKDIVIREGLAGVGM